MSCNLRIIEGKEVGFTDAGAPSKLYKDAVNKLGEEEGRDVFLVSLSEDFKETVPPTEKPNAKVIGDKYLRLITEIKASQPEEYWSVDIPSTEEIREAAEAGRIVDVAGGMGIVTEDGNMIGMFKYDQSKKGTAAEVQAARVKLGGIKMDNFDNYLTKIYQRNGFKVAARVPFNEEYAPEGWRKELHGTPDVVSMIYDPNNSLGIEEKTFSDYEEALSYRDSFVDEAKSTYPLVEKEPSLEQVMQYITSQNENKVPMNADQMRDYKNSFIGTNGFTFENLKKAFYDKNGVFFVSVPKLVSSGLYSQYEAEHLQKDTELQEKVKTSVEALKNTEEVITPTQEDFEQVEKENLFNSFGKLNNLNPYIVQKQIQDTLAATTREEFDELLGELPFPSFQKSVESEVAKDALFRDMQKYKKAEVLIDVRGQIKPSLKSNTEVVVLQVAQDLEGTKVLSDIKYVLQQDINILKANIKETRTLLKSIEKGLINEGYDVIGLEAKNPDAFMMEYLSAVSDLSENASQESVDEYVRVYDSYFESDLSNEKGYIKTEQDDRNFVKLDTELTEEETYNQQGLIKQEEGVYIKVNKKSSEELYPIVVTYPEKLPEGVKTEEELKKYVQSQINNDEVSDAETAEVINLFKMYYGIPLQEEGRTENFEEFDQKQAQFTGNQEYLTTDFISDFYIEGLKEKVKESKAYRDFYRHFKITEKGLELINTDPITLDSIQEYVTEDLANYSLLSKSMPNLKIGEVEIVESRNNRRNKVANYPSILPKFDGNLSLLDDNHIIAKNTNDEFLRIKGDVYENTQTISNLTMYKKLDTLNKNFLSLAVEKPTSEFLLEDYIYLEDNPESFIKAKNYLTNKEKEKLYNEEFECL